MSDGFTLKTSKKARKKKVAALTGKGLPSEKSKKKEKASRPKSKYRNGSHQNYDNQYEEDYDARPMLTGRQFQLLQKIAQCFPHYKSDNVLPRIITKMNLTSFDPNNDRQKIEVLDGILNEMEHGMSGRGKANRRQENENSQIEEGRNPSRDSGKRRAAENKQKKSGKFKQIMMLSGSTFLEYLDKETLWNLIRIKPFSFILRGNALSSKLRLACYTSPNDIQFRINTFNSQLDTQSSLTLYKVRKASRITTKQCLNLIILNNLNLDARFRAHNQKRPQPNMVQFDVSKSKSLTNERLSQEILRAKCKEINIWSSINIADLNNAYLTEFAHYQQRDSPPNAQSKVDGRMYKQYLDEIVFDRLLLSSKNVKSVHCAYLKVNRNYQLQSFLLLLIELNTRESDFDRNPKQFMVWCGQCGAN